MYKYQTEKSKIFTEDGQETFLKIRDKAQKETIELLAKTLIEVRKHMTAHIPEKVVGFNFINNQRIFLFEVSRLYRLLEIVHGTQVIFPCIINHHQRNCFFQTIAKFFGIAVERLLHVGEYIDSLASITERHHYIFDLVALRETDIFENRNSLFF